ncbi:MAG: hypothetical protein RBG13Loki_1467 [Promethearchaeota archaeon CR_4]|nr:MAG: hypothetical protein RBG13Loki_1467 [Candidatus Lokiarchaeota archaeon CR_4]
MKPNQKTLGLWAQGIDPTPVIGVRVDCYVSVYPGFKCRYPKAYFEFLTERNPYGPPSPLAPPGMLLYAASASSGRWAPGWTQIKFDNTYLQFLQSPICQARIKLLHEIAKKNLIFLVGFNPNPRIFGRIILKQLIENGKVSRPMKKSLIQILPAIFGGTPISTTKKSQIIANPPPL